MEGERVFEAVGISETEERLYRFLLERPGSSLPDIARSIASSRERARATVASLEAKGLASRSASRVPRFMPARPDLAIEVLILRRQEELEATRLAATRLFEEFRTSAQRTNPVELVEVLTGREAVVQRFRQLQTTAQEVVLAFDKPPYATPPAHMKEELEHLKRGVPARVIYDRDSLEEPGQPDGLRTLIGAGEDARMLAGLPMKMMIVDRRLALVPLTVDEPGLEGAAVIHASPLLKALTMLFETLWERAIPIRFAGDEVARDSNETGALSETDERLLVLLAAGLKDEAIARQLGIGRRTVQRRVRRIMDLLGAGNRPEAILHATKRGWL